MDTIHQVIITNSTSFISVKGIRVDILRPKEARRCFISVSKFNAIYPLLTSAGFNAPFTEEFSIYCDSIQNSYIFDQSSSMVIRSNLLDTYVTTHISSPTVLGVLSHVACFNVINNLDNWMEIDISRLNSLSFSFGSTYLEQIGIDHYYNLHLRFKFSE